MRWEPLKLNAITSWTIPTFPAGPSCACPAASSGVEDQLPLDERSKLRGQRGLSAASAQGSQPPRSGRPRLGSRAPSCRPPARLVAGVLVARHDDGQHQGASPACSEAKCASRRRTRDQSPRRSRLTSPGGSQSLVRSTVSYLVKSTRVAATTRCHSPGIDPDTEQAPVASTWQRSRRGPDWNRACPG